LGVNAGRIAQFELSSLVLWEQLFSIGCDREEGVWEDDLA